MNNEREACPHDVQLGILMTDDEIALQIANAREHPAVLAILQALRTKAVSMGRDGRTVPPQCANPGDWRSFHDGGETGLEEFFWSLVAMRKTELDKELEEGEDSAEEGAAT